MEIPDHNDLLEDSERLLPEIAGRITIALFSLIFGGMSAFALYALYFSEIPPFGLLFSFILLVTKELFWAILTVASLSLIWAIFTPAWVERVFVAAYKHLWLAIALGFVPVFILMVLAIFGLKLGQGLDP
jgi:hypothetical protein